MYSSSINKFCKLFLLVTFSLITTALVVLLWCTGCSFYNEKNSIQLTPATVSRVVDGDTLEVNVENKLKKVRLIGIDAPESVHPDESKNSQSGILASDYLRSILPEGSVVYLEYEIELQDKYGRELCDVWLDDISKTNFDINKLLNYKLVKDGYAFKKTYEPNSKYASQLEL